MSPEGWPVSDFQSWKPNRVHITEVGLGWGFCDLQPKASAPSGFHFFLFLVSNQLSRWKIIKHKTHQQTAFLDARWPDPNLRLSGSQCQDVFGGCFHSSQIPGVSALSGLSRVSPQTGWWLDALWKERTWKADLRGSGRRLWVWGKQVREPHLGEQAAFQSTVNRLLERIETESIFTKTKAAIRTSAIRT